MKRIKHKDFIDKCIFCILFVLLSIQTHAQCGTETFTVVDWCENAYAEWTITNPDVTAKYHWYEPVYNAAGTLIVDTLDRNYGENATGTNFVSPYRYTTPSPTPVTPGWDNRAFWYVKEKATTFSLNNPTVENHASAPTTGYSMNFTSALETRINYVTIPFFSYYVDPSKTWYVQMQIDSKYSAVYYFNSTNLIKVTSNIYLLRVPVFISTQAGAHVMTVVTNPASPTAGTVAIGTNQLDLAMLNTATTFPINNTAGINITGASNSGKSIIYTWETDTYCPYTFTPAAKKKTTGCCVPVLTSTVVTTSNPIIVSSTDNSTLNVTAYESLSNYFQWYKDGVLLAGKGGTGLAGFTSIVVSQPGVYSVREVKTSGDINNISCYQEGSILIQERFLFAKVNNPKASYCIGDKVTVEAYGTNIGSVSWAPASLAASPNSKITEVTLNSTGTLNFTATAKVFIGPSIVNGDFESGNTGFTSDMTNTSGTPSSGQYRIDTYVTEQQSYWSTSTTANPATQMKGSGKFLYSDGFQTYQPGSNIWKQTVTGLSQNQDYTFSMDHANISWNSDPYNAARVADVDTKFDIYINNVKIATFTTDGQSQYAGVGRWKTDQVVWNSSTATQAIIEIKQQVKGGAGYDFAIDNILFGGPVVQTASVSVGPITDCYDVIATQSACVGTDKILSAKAINTSTGEEVGVVDHWEIIPGNALAGSGKTITVSPVTTTTYVAYGYFPGGNLIQNGDFELGANGFNYGSTNGLYNLTTSPGPGSIAILKNPQTETGNIAYANMGDHTSGTGTMLLVDPGSADGDIISYNFNANANQNYLFSLWAANAVNFTQNPNGISASLSFIINGPGVTNLQISSIDLPRNNNWIQLSDVWKPTTSGAYTLTVRAKGDATLAPIQSAATGQSINGGNDYVLDDIVLAEPTSKVYTDTLVVTPCVTCTQPTNVVISVPAAAADTICQGTAKTLSGTVRVSAASTASGGFRYKWIKVGATPAADVVLQTAAITIPTATTTPVPNYAGITGTIANAGKYILRVEDGTSNSNTCFLDDTLTLVVTAPVTAGTIAANQEICSGTIPTALTGTVSTGGVTIKNYKWESSATVTGPWIQRAAYSNTGTGFTSAALTATTYFRRIDSSGACPGVPTNTIIIRVNNKPILSSLIPVLRDTLCVGENFNLSTVIPLADSTGIHASANGGYYFYWKKYQAGIAVSTTAPLPYRNLLSAVKPAVLSDSGMYYLIVQDGIGATKCKDSIGLRIVVNQAPTSKGLIASHQEICLTDAASVLTESKAPSGFILSPVYHQWYTTPDSTGTPTLTKISTSTATTYDPGSPTITQYYVRKDSVKFCAAVATNFLKIRVNNSVVADTILPLENDTLCVSAGSLFQLKGVVDSTGLASINKGYHFTWMHLQEPATVPVVVGTSGVYADYPPTSRVVAEADSGTYYLIIRDGAGATVCQDTLKTKVVVYATCTIISPCVKPVSVSTTLIGNDTLCVGNGFTIQKDVIDLSAGPPSDAYYYSWRRINSAGSVLLSPPSLTYSDLVVTNSTQADSGRYYLIVQDGLGSDPACAESSSAISIVINAPITVPVVQASDTICQGSVPALFTGTIRTLPTHYQWYISTDSFKTVPASQRISGAISDSYQSTALINTSYFIRKDSVDACPAVNSNILTIQVDKPVIPGVVGNDTVVCSGSPILAFKEITAASGGTGMFNYQWQSSSDNVTFTDITAATNNIYQSPVIFSRIYFRRIDSSGVCGSKITDTIFVDAVTGVNPGVIAGTSPTICYNTIPTISFTNVTGASNGSGGPGSETYQWQISTDDMYWTDIAGANGLSYTETNPLTDTMYYRRKVGMGPGSCDTSYTTSLAINVYDPFVVGSIPTDITVCEGTSVTINELTASTGGGDPNTQVYEWIESTDKGMTWITSSGISNQVNYVTPLLVDSIWYRRVVTVACNKDTSNIMKVNVDSINTVHITMADVSTCGGTDAVFAPIYSGEGTTPLFEWYVGPSASGPSWTKITGAAASSYTVVNPQAIDNGTFYKVVLTSSFTCNSGTEESVAQLIVNNVVVPLVSITSNPSGPICDSTTSITYTASAIQGDAGAATYQWYDGATGLAIPSATGKTYTPAAPPANGDQIYVVMTSDITCASPLTAQSNKIILDVRVKPQPIITNNDTTVCTPFEVILKASAITSGSNNFQWYKDGILIPNANQTNYTATANDFPGGKYTFVEDNGICNTVSDTVIVTMLQSPSAYAGTDITAVEGETISLNGSVSSNTTYYVWMPSAGLSDAYVLQPSLIVPGATTTYSLVAYNNANVCYSSDVVTIYVEKRIVIPNVITVNGDGVNDTWFIENIENFPDVEVLIYNRWGNLVWKSTGYAKQWDGTNYRNGEVLSDGTYFYIIDLHSAKVKNSYSGWVQIIK